IYAKGADRKNPLVTFSRRAMRSGSRLEVTREYHYPDGRLAAREQVHYEGDALISYELENSQTGEHGSAVIGADPKKPAHRVIIFKWSKAGDSKSKPQTREEILRKDVLINDMVGPFLLS